jgi:hypothetical protein
MSVGSATKKTEPTFITTVTAKKLSTKKTVNISNQLMYDLSIPPDTLDFFEDTNPDIFGNLIQETLDPETLILIEELNYDDYNEQG